MKGQGFESMHPRKITHIDEAGLQTRIGQLVRVFGEEMLNGLLVAEANRPG